MYPSDVSKRDIHMYFIWMYPRDVSKRDIHYMYIYAINPPHGNPFAAPTIYLFPIFLIKLPNCSNFPALAIFSN
jgi:hypothetical protein